MLLGGILIENFFGFQMKVEYRIDGSDCSLPFDVINTCIAKYMFQRESLYKLYSVQQIFQLLVYLILVN